MNSSNNLKLIFPEFEYKLTKKEGKLFIFDSISKKYRALSPEEWVRQNFLLYLNFGSLIIRYLLLKKQINYIIHIIYMLKTT